MVEIVVGIIINQMLRGLMLSRLHLKDDPSVKCSVFDK